MNRASLPDLRKALESASALARAGIAFVCMPALNDDDLERLRLESLHRLDQLAESAERQ